MTTLNLLIAGQSFAGFLANDAVAKAALAAEFTRFGVTMTPWAQTYDGSSIIKANAPATHPTWYWWDDTTNSAGPLLTAAISYINSIASGSKPTRIIWGQGEADSVGPNPDPVLFKAGTIAVLAALKAALGTNPGIVMLAIGRRLASGAVPGVQVIREAQLDLIAGNTYVFGSDIYDLILLGDDSMITGDAGNSHMIAPDRGVMGWRIAQRLLQSLLVATYREQPSVGTITRSGNDVVIPMGPAWTGGALVKPVNPANLAIRDATGVIESPDLGFAWSGNTLTITPNRAFGAGVFLAPYGEVDPIDRDNLIRDTLYRLPLRATKAAIPA